MAFLVATTSLPAVYRPNGYARTTTAGTPHARAKIYAFKMSLWGGQLPLVLSLNYPVCVFVLGGGSSLIGNKIKLF